MAAKSMYRITASQVDTVEVGSLVVDDDTGKRQEWNVLCPGTGRIQTFAGQRTHRLCPECFEGPEPLVRAIGHDHPHGEGPNLDLDA